MIEEGIIKNVDIVDFVEVEGTFFPVIMRENKKTLIAIGKQFYKAACFCDGKDYYYETYHIV